MDLIDLIFKTSASLQRRGVALSEIYQIYHVRGIPNKKTDLQKNVENANATNTGQIVQYIALNLSVCSVVLRKEIQIIHRLFLAITMYCQAPSMNH